MPRVLCHAACMSETKHHDMRVFINWRAQLLLILAIKTSKSGGDCATPQFGLEALVQDDNQDFGRD